MSSHDRDYEKNDDTAVLKCETHTAEDASYASTASNSVSPFNGSLGISPVSNDHQLSIDQGVETAITTNLDRIHMLDDNPENYMIAPSTREAKENERYARKVGICFSITRGDYLTLFTGFPDDESMTDLSAALSVSPQYGKTDSGFTFREMYGNVHQILDIPTDMEQPVIHQVVDKPAKRDEDSVVIQSHCELISPRTRNAMVIHNDVVETIRERAGILSKDWTDRNNLAPTLARRLRDFEFAQKKRRRMFGKIKKWGILGFYDFLSEVRQDVEWAEDAAFRRTNCLPYVRWSDFVLAKTKGSNRPFFAYGILFICLCTLIISIGLNGWAFEPASTNPSFGPSAEVLLKMGAKQSHLIVNSYQLWRLFSPMILHGGIVHFLLNSFAIFYIGRAVEQNHGSFNAAILFAMPAVGSTIISAIFLPQFISVGASGGIFGLIGACVAEIIKNRKLLFSDFINKGRSKRHHTVIVMILVLDIFLNLLMGLTPYTDNFMHVGGFVLGFICASTMLGQVNIEGEVSRFKSPATSLFTRYFGLLVCCICIIVSTVILFNGDGITSPCEDCGVLSCVSFPPWADYDKKWWYCDDCGGVAAFGIRDEVTNEYSSLEMECPQGHTIVFSLDGLENSKVALQQNLSIFCRERCFN